jgi:hypothetical protein
MKTMTLTLRLSFDRLNQAKAWDVRRSTLFISQIAVGELKATETGAALSVQSVIREYLYRFGLDQQVNPKCQLSWF